MIKIKSIQIENFKVFGKEIYTINFNERDLFLMDGPNGYGKTSVFDAIELALSGTIKRLISTDGRQTPKDVVIAHDPLLPVSAEIVLSKGGDEDIYIRRVLKKTYPDAAKKISRFHELWDVSIKKGDGWKKVQQTEVNHILNNKNFLRDFHLFHYIQQEESSAFLKKNSETERANEISQLFGDTANAEMKYKKLKAVQEKLNALSQSENKLSNILLASHKIDNTVKNSAPDDREYKTLLPWFSDDDKKPAWDRNVLASINQEEYVFFRQETEGVLELVKHRDIFLTTLPFLKVERSQELLKLYISCYNSINTLHDYEKQASNDALLARFRNALIAENFPTNVTDAFELIGRNDSESYKSAWETLTLSRRATEGLKSAYAEIVSQHVHITHILEKIPDEKDCPYCGEPYDSHSDLKDAGQSRLEKLKSSLSSQEVNIHNLENNFKKNFTDTIVEQIELYRANNPPLSEKSIDLLRIAVASKERLDNFNKWLQSLAISVTDLLSPTMAPELDEEEINKNCNYLLYRIRDQQPIINIDYQNANVNGSFDRLFKEYFESKRENLLKITEKDIEGKIDYISDKYNLSNKDVIKKINLHQERSKQLEIKAKEIDKIAKGILKKIRAYKKELISDIEIPFYIYSGKILRSHQSGSKNGIFLKDPTGGEELKNIRLVSNYDRDHDVMNTMSSGQISAIVISLSLALNKIYCGNFSAIMIDDPVQSMDDINMTSVVDLLRHEFHDRQIILSTHEDKVSKFFTYKYLKHGKSVRKLNLMNNDEYDSVDDYYYPEIVTPEMIKKDPPRRTD